MSGQENELFSSGTASLSCRRESDFKTYTFDIAAPRFADFRKYIKLK